MTGVSLAGERNYGSGVLLGRSPIVSVSTTDRAGRRQPSAERLRRP